MEARIYCVYVHENQINGKVYVGMTSNPKFRFAGNGSSYKHSRNGGTTAFGKAIEEYGWDAFSHEILWDDLTIDEARRLERFAISYYDSTNPEKGYNRHPGGTGYTEHFTRNLTVVKR